jgi:hypothetical protein
MLFSNGCYEPLSLFADDYPCIDVLNHISSYRACNMKDNDKFREQNMGDLEKLRQQVAELEQSLQKEQEQRKGIEASQDLLQVLGHVQFQFILDAEPRVLFDRLLTDLLLLTESEYGFIGEVLLDDNGDPYMKTYAITNIAWNETWMQF